MDREFECEQFCRGSHLVVCFSNEKVWINEPIVTAGDKLKETLANHDGRIKSAVCRVIFVRLVAPRHFPLQVRNSSESAHRKCDRS